MKSEKLLIIHLRGVYPLQIALRGVNNLGFYFGDFHPVTCGKGRLRPRRINSDYLISIGSNIDIEVLKAELSLWIGALTGIEH